MRVFDAVSEWQEFRKNSFFDKKSIGFIPTMGCLHQGHLSLINKARTENEIVVLSIYVNGKQFSNSDDYINYPRTKLEDLILAEEAQVDFVILPTDNDIYPDDFHYKVTEDLLSLKREGVYRPGHFTGMLTVVLKFLLLVRPTKAYFGEKDYQQYELVKGMRQAFFLDTEIVLCPTVRISDRLAYSSRNQRLNAEQLDLAKNFPRLLSSKELSSEQIIIELTKLGFDVVYINQEQDRRYGCVKLGEVFLIDNFLI